MGWFDIKLPFGNRFQNSFSLVRGSVLWETLDLRGKKHKEQDVCYEVLLSCSSSSKAAVLSFPNASMRVSPGVSPCLMVVCLFCLQSHVPTELQTPVGQVVHLTHPWMLPNTSSWVPGHCLCSMNAGRMHSLAVMNEFFNQCTNSLEIHSASILHYELILGRLDAFYRIMSTMW